MKIVKISAQRPDSKVIAHAAEIIRRGGLVVFPTETVYGLGADAFNARAVRKIFKIKGRPEKKPLIVHISKKSTIDILARDVPSVARALVRKFWSGPLTLVFHAQKALPDLVLGKLNSSIVPSMELFIQPKGRVKTVAVRMPAHKVALALIRAAGPLAAPSANFSGEKPPTRVSDISRALLRRVDLVLDAGSTSVRVPSTVLDLTVSPPKILREGAINKKQLKKFL
ncbi:L-threonylcarbamoyladenylate synthase [Candidatus Uhrbacteria bacterium]|nr:L-threonylcarbamoyladenylate synthase [Candidatus Uhrbacteria bacterium]